ncbi:2,4-dienoyl-CoA reductase [Lachnospiraceae bacterium]|uniref:NAD(P)/FAD-dependent oxidoreductase n=1 Tax=Extibacter sp. GGCC_0201 TaxID=2731209 RepID=UPI001AA1776D|nr:NAD(P)/FAD-dependent oxidoreductase [Extibacter sp. GGCC_0201]MBO1722158.1 FAD-dependent oxidoreductase [Extibacter sp. GGCC_0201]BDF33426.1 2,4-dienoyl-CoA reductase [Lachnospiraceae bacterium]BDF37430.1 2,4-dienoyl-CoA reductase [Lachnospiraceae bacterium]
MKNNFKHLFSPLSVRGMTMKNRVVMMPMGSNLAEHDGSMSDEHIAYYELRAKGGTGLILVENICVKYPEGANGTTQLRIDKDCYIPRLYKLTEACHRHGACMGIQLNHAGASAMSARTGMQPVSSSVLPSKPGGECPRPLSREELESIAADYGAAARRAVNAGFDLVEIHAGHSYLISQFLSPTMNDRTDEFGGCAKNRARFCRMVIDEVRSAVGPRVPVSLRLSVDELVDGGNTIDDCLEYLEFLDDGVDIYDTSAALNPSIQYQIDANYLADGWRSYMARAVREKFHKPTIAIGNIRSPQAAEDILAKGDADLIGIGRGLIADPDWCCKARRGDVSGIRKCISCNVGCVGNRIGGNRPLRCTINPDVTGGDAYKRQKVARPCNVVVAGAGTAGLEAACTAAEAGCSVTLLEKQDHIGGLSVEISKIPAKKRLADFPAYLRHRAEELDNLTIQTGVDATADIIRSFQPDLVVNATGSVPLLPPIDGLHENLADRQSNVYSILDLIHNIDRYPEDMSGKSVIVIGGGAVGLDVVEFFAPRGADTTIIEMMPSIGNGLDASSTASMKECMEKHKVKQLVNTALKKVNPHSFLVEQGGKEVELPFDYGFVCLGMKAHAPIWDALTKAFENEDIALLNIGDSVRARRIIDGTDAGRHMVLNTLKQLGYL